MTDKERLERVEAMLHWADKYQEEGNGRLVDQTVKQIYQEFHIDWLIRQVKRVQELEEENINLKAIKAANEELIKLLAERTEALKDKYLALRNIHNITLKTGELVAEENKRYKQAMQNAINACRYTNPEVAYILSEALEDEE